MRRKMPGTAGLLVIVALIPACVVSSEPNDEENTDIGSAGSGDAGGTGGIDGGFAGSSSEEEAGMDAAKDVEESAIDADSTNDKDGNPPDENDDAGEGGFGGGASGTGGAGGAGGCGGGNTVPNFTLKDINPDSPTYNVLRSLHDNCGKVLMIYCAAWWDGHSAGDFAVMNEIVQDRYSNDYTYADLEVWSLGNDGDANLLDAFAGNNTGACFEDDPSGSAKDALALGDYTEKLIILDRNLVKVKTFDIDNNRVTEDSNRQAVDDFIGTLL